MFKDKFTNLFGKKEGEVGNKRKVENLVVFIIILIITIIVINVIWNDDNNESNNSDDKVDQNKKLAETTQVSDNGENSNNSITTSELVTDLEEILSSISGVGEVKVMVTYS